MAKLFYMYFNLNLACKLQILFSLSAFLEMWHTKLCVCFYIFQIFWRCGTPNCVFVSIYSKFSGDVAHQIVCLLSPAAPKARDGRYCNAPRPSVRPSVRPSRLVFAL